MRKPNQRSLLRLLYSVLGVPSAGWGGHGPVIKVPADAKPPRNHVRRILIRDTGPAIVEQGLGGLPTGSRVLLVIPVIPPLMGYGPNGNPLCERRRHAGVRHRHRGRTGAKPLKRRKEFSYGPPYMQPFRLMQNLAGIPGQPAQVR
jgi:hypothetical protein